MEKTENEKGYRRTVIMMKEEDGQAETREEGRGRIMIIW